MTLTPDDPRVWGPALWRVLHLFAAAYDDDASEERRSAYEAWINLLPEVLPCGKCADHLDENLERMPVAEALQVSRRARAILPAYVFSPEN